MALWSRLAEFVQDIGEGLGGLFGGPKPPEKSVAFTIAMIALSAKMAKADGTVTNDEIAAFAEVFQVPEAQKASVQRVFSLAQQDTAGYDSYAAQVADLFSHEETIKAHEMLENVLDGLFHIAKADGAVHADELKFLESISDIFGFQKKDFGRIRARHVAFADDPYEILGLSPDATVAEVKKKYRALARDLHPDKQIANGMPAELVVIATERLARINAAYGQITKPAAASKPAMM